ncbi:MAG: DNA repair protein RecO [Desulfuromonadales bacterium]|nr:DNA repair protein RecO [Desulfuromonadales bacterium]
MHIHSDEAIILHSRDYGEADRIVTALTRNHGLLRGFARNARKSRKRFGPALEPFALLKLIWNPPRSGELSSLREAEILDLRTGLRRDLPTLALAGYGLELTERLTPEGDLHTEHFALLNAFLDHLGAVGAAPTAKLLFELRLVQLAGLMPHLLHCAICNAPFTEDIVPFSAGYGGGICATCATGNDGPPVNVATLGSLSRCLRAPVTVFADLHLGATTLREGGSILGAALAAHLDRPLASSAFLQLADSMAPVDPRKK